MQSLNKNLYWQKKSKIKNIYPYLTDNISCDVLVVGGGITGALTTYFLAKSGVNVIVVEKNIIGYGSTIVAPALLDFNLDIFMYKLEKILNKEKSQKIYKLCLNAIDLIEEIDREFEANTEFKRQDSIYFTNRFMQKMNMTKEFEARKNAGFNSRLIDSHDLLNITSGILTKNSSAILNPYEFTQNLFEYLNTFNNVKIFENTSVETIKCLYNSVECRTNNDFKIKSNSLIFTSGIDTLKYLEDTDLIELYKIFTVVSSPLVIKDYSKNKNVNFTARDSMDSNHYLRFDNDGRIILAGENTKFVQKFLDKKYMNNLANEKYKKLSNYLNKLLNTNDNIPIEYNYNSTYINTKDTLPIVDEMPNMPNCFCNLGFGSNGIIYSTIGASMLKNAINGLYTKDMNMFKIDR
jgi:glycine/D-amino acid oxidase-like deaminating enzyme